MRERLLMKMAIDCCIILPPFFKNVGVIVALAIVALLVGIALLSSGYVTLTAKTCTLLIILTILPTQLSAAPKHLGHLVAVIVQALLATLMVTGYIIWTIGTTALGVWIGFLFGLLFVLLVGAHFLDLQKKRVLNRLVGSEKYPLATKEAERLESTMKRGILLYLSIPIGAIISILYGWVAGISEVVAVVLIAPTILIAASLILLIMLITSAAGMSNSLILLEPVSIQASIVEKPKPSFLKKFLTRFLKLRLAGLSEQDETNYTQGMNIACAVSDLRKLYFYDSVHNCTLLFGFSAAIVGFVSSVDIISTFKWFVFIFFLLLFLFCYLPYSIGQLHLYEEIIDAYLLDGLARNNLKRKLKDASPLYPLSDFGGALIASGTVGGLIVTLVIEALKNAVK